MQYALSLDQDAIYRADRADGRVEVARAVPYYDRDTGHLESLILLTNNRAHDLTYMTSTAAKDGGVIFTFGGTPSYTLTPLELGDEKDVWVKGQKTFPTLEDLTAYSQKAIDLADNYIPNVPDEQSLAFTKDGKGNVLELIMDNADGDLFYRENGEWVQLHADNDYPTIYDRDTIEVDPDDIDSALKFWDAAQSTDADVKDEQVYPFAKMYQ